MIRDPYQVLGLSPGATQEEIKQAYRRCVKQWHPDLHPGDDRATQKMKEINEAYEMLTDPDKRAAYQQGSGTHTADPAGHSGQRQAGQGAGNQSGHYHTYDFEDFFGFGSAYRRSSGHFHVLREPGDSAAICYAVDAINSGRYQQALQTLRQVPSAGRNARWHCLYGVSLHGAGDPARAEEELRHAVRLDPGKRQYESLLRQMQQENRDYAARGAETGSYGGEPFSALSMLGRVMLGLFGLRFLVGFLQMTLYGFPFLQF